MAAGQRSTEGQGEECLVWQAGRQAGLNFAFLRAAQDSTEEFGPAQAVIEKRSKTRTTKVRLSGLAGRQTRSKVAWEGSLGTFPRALPNPRPSAKAGLLKTQAQTQLQLELQSQLAAHGRGSHGPRPRARSRQEEQLLPKSDVLCTFPVPTCVAKRLAIKQAQPASEGRAKGSRRGLDGALFAGVHRSVSSGVSRFVSASSLFLITIRDLEVSRCVSGCDQLTPSSLNSIICESRLPSMWST